MFHFALPTRPTHQAVAELSYLAHQAVETDKFRTETCCIVGNYFSLRGQHERAVVHFQRALRLNRAYLSAWTLMGHEFVELKNPAAAIGAALPPSLAAGAALRSATTIRMRLEWARPFTRRPFARGARGLERLRQLSSAPQIRTDMRWRSIRETTGHGTGLARRTSFWCA